MTRQGCKTLCGATPQKHAVYELISKDICKNTFKNSNNLIFKIVHTHMYSRKYVITFFLDGYTIHDILLKLHFILFYSM